MFKELRSQQLIFLGIKIICKLIKIPTNTMLLQFIKNDPCH